MANQQHIQWLREGVDAWNRRREADRFTPDFSGANIGDEVMPLPGLLEITYDTQPPVEWKENPFQGINLSRANLSHARINYADLSNADFNGANLSHARIACADLSHADLKGANLEDASLIGVFLRRAQMNNTRLNRARISTANLAGADLAGANFTGSVLINVNLSEANLRDAVLTDAILCDGVYVRNANLVSTNLTGIGITYLPPALWTAKLYPENKSPKQHLLESTTVETVGGWLESVKLIRDIYTHYDEEVLFYFRGESQCGWDLRPSVMRSNSLIISEGRMLVDLISRRPEDFSGTSSALTQWVLAQHHGLKTRFLDITSNPLVALFHACATDQPEEPLDGRLHVFAAPRSIVKPFNSDSVSIVANFAKLSSDDQSDILSPAPARIMANFGTRWGNEEAISYEPAPGDLLPSMRQLYQLIRMEKPYFDERIDPRDFYHVFVVEPQKSSERIQAQSGAFLVSAFHERFERSEILKRNPDIPIYAHYDLTISGRHKEAIRNELQSLKITHESLFPGLDASAQAITEQIEATVQSDTSLSTYERSVELEERLNLIAKGGSQLRERMLKEMLQ